MNVLVQLWSTDQGFVFSISKDQAQLDATKRRAEREDDGTELVDDHWKHEIPDDSPFARMVERETVFLHRDESDELDIYQ